MELNERLRKVRNDMGLTQADFAELGGVKVLAQTNYERGLRVPSLEYLLKLKESGVDINYIIFGEIVDTARLSRMDHKLLYAYQNASKERKQAIEFVAGIRNDDNSSDECKDDVSNHQSDANKENIKSNNSFFSMYSLGDIGLNTFNFIFKVVPTLSIMTALFWGLIYILTTEFIPLFSENRLFTNVGSLGITMVALVLIISVGVRSGEKLLNYQDSNLVRLRQLKVLLAK